MDGSLHDRDFHAWTQQQAAALRRLAETRPNLDAALDLPNLVEEVEDRGSEQVSKVRGNQQQALEHLPLVAFAPEDPAVRHRRAEIVTLRDNAADPYRASMRQQLEPRLDRLWRVSPAAAGETLGRDLPGPPTACPFTPDALLDDAVDLDALLTRLAPEDRGHG